MGDLKAIQDSFSIQAERFSAGSAALTDPQHLEWMLASLKLTATATVLDDAAGTGLLAHAIAPRVRQVLALDATAAMLRVGQNTLSQAKLRNIIPGQSRVEKLPAAAETFDVVVCRFAIHHFPDPGGPVTEMIRVCRPGGRVVLIDLVSPEDPTLAQSYNRLEQLRDPSHARALTCQELEKLLDERGLVVSACDTREITVRLDPWLAVTKTDDDHRKSIREALVAEQNGQGATGMRPFTTAEGLCFRQTWALVVGDKRKDVP